MSYQNDVEAFILANTYGFCPPRIISPSKRKRLDHGKYEPDRNEFAQERVMLLAHWKDHTNVLIRYEPAELVP